MKINEKVAKELVRIARELVAFQPDDTDDAKQAEAQAAVEEFEKFVSELPQDVQDAQAEVEKAEKALADAKKALKDKYQSWASETGFDKAKKAFELALEKFQKFHVNVSGISTKYGKLTAGRSTRSADAELVNVLLSLMNETMRTKYASIREDFKKLTIQYKTGNKLLDVEFSAFNDNAQELIEKEKINVKKGSVEVTAGVWDKVKDFAGAVKDFFAGVIAKFAAIVTEAESVSNDLDAVNEKIEGKLTD